MDFSQGRLAADFEALAGLLRSATVHVRSGHRGSGSGVVWASDGLIVTNAHVTGRHDPGIELPDGREVSGKLVALDEQRDLAAVRIDVSALPALSHADSDDVRVGQVVVAMGNPLGISSALTTGIVHAIAKKRQERNDWIQADIDLAPGNSGGPLADVRGHVIGINSMVAGGLGLAVPSNAVLSFLGQSVKPRLGIAIHPVDVPYGSSSSSKRVPGLLIVEIAADSFAERTGLAIGDVIVGIAGAIHTDHRELGRALANSSSGLAEVDIIRGGSLRRIVVSGAREFDQEAA